MTLFWSSSYRISDGAIGSVQSTPSRAALSMKLTGPGAAMLLRPIEREHKHDGMETRNTAAVLRDSQLLPTDAAEAFWRLV